VIAGHQGGESGPTSKNRKIVPSNIPALALKRALTSSRTVREQGYERNQRNSHD
jgi:hypothetical protein